MSSPLKNKILIKIILHFRFCRFYTSMIMSQEQDQFFCLVIGARKQAKNLANVAGCLMSLSLLLSVSENSYIAHISFMCYRLLWLQNF